MKARKQPGKPSTDRPKNYRTPADDFKIGTHSRATYSGLGANYRRLYRNMVEHGVPKAQALEYANKLRLAQNRYNKHSRSFDRDDFSAWFEEQFYDPLWYDYSYDIDEDYPEED